MESQARTPNQELPGESGAAGSGSVQADLPGQVSDVPGADGVAQATGWCKVERVLELHGISEVQGHKENGMKTKLKKNEGLAIIYQDVTIRGHHNIDEDDAYESAVNFCKQQFPGYDDYQPNWGSNRRVINGWNLVVAMTKKVKIK